MSVWFVIFCVFIYLALLAGVAFWAEKRANTPKSILTKPWIYSLSLAVYCTAWTFYGSVGRVVNNGVDFLTIYIGPLIASVLLWVVLRKIVRISKTQKISSLADFLSNRYGKSISLGGLVALFSILGIIPYISLQLKSISESIYILTNQEHLNFGGYGVEVGLVVAITVTLFTVFFGLRKIDLTEKHEGIVAVIAVEAIVKLVAILVVGFLAVIILNGLESNHAVAGITQKPVHPLHWSSMILLSFFAFFLLPRQWQMAVTENVKEGSIKKASWQFPLYLLLINLSIVPIALAGLNELPFGTNPDYFVLSLPLFTNHTGIAFLAFFGGFAAATGMIVVSTISLATMLTNNLILPVSFKLKLLSNPQRFIGRIGIVRRISVFVIAGLAYLYYRFVVLDFSLVSIGLISFVAVAQFGPATIGALFWKKGNKRAAFWGIVAGGLVWFLVFILPSLAQSRILPQSFDYSSVFTQNYFGLQMPSHITAGFCLSLFLNALIYVGVSVYSKQNSTQLNQAELFVDVYKYSNRLEENLIWRGKALNRDLKRLLFSFLGNRKGKQALNIYERRYNKGKIEDSDLAEYRFVTYTENVLSGVIGSSSARIMVSSVTTEEQITRDDVVSILLESKETKDLNAQLKLTTEQLKETSQKLSAANKKLLLQDEAKNEFLYTITHEIRTPITSIRAFTELMNEDLRMPEKDRKRFLEIMNTELVRLSKLISQVLDLEKYESGKYTLSPELTNVNQLIEESLLACNAVLTDRGVKVYTYLQKSIDEIKLDKDKMKQVFINLISNAAKYSHPDEGEIKVSSYYVNDEVRINVKDNGSGVSSGEAHQIFDKFYQIKKEAKGNGLGLAISKEIVTLHKGKIWVDKDYKQGAKICLSIPIKN